MQIRMHMKRALRQTQIQFEGAAKRLIRVETYWARTQSLRASIEHKILVVVDNRYHHAHVIVAGAGVGFDCNIHLVAGLELNAQPAFSVNLDMRNPQATVAAVFWTQALLLT